MNDSLDRNLRWGLAIRWLHWLTVGLLAIQVAVAFTLLKQPGMAAAHWLPLHMSMGFGLLAVVVLRLFWRALTRAPEQPFHLAARLSASLVHAGLYILLVAGAVTGWLAYQPSPLMPRALLFGSFLTPATPRFQFASPRDFAGAHEIIVWALLVFITVHVGTVLVHEFMARDKVLPRMLFGKERERRP